MESSLVQAGSPVAAAISYPWFKSGADDDDDDGERIASYAF